MNPAKLAALRGACSDGEAADLSDEALGMLLGMVGGDAPLALDALRMQPRPRWLEQLEEL